MERDSSRPQTGSHNLHGHSACLFDRFPELLLDLSLWLAELGRGRVGEIYRRRLGPTDLLHHLSDAFNPRIYGLAFGDHYCDSGAAGAIRPPPKTWPIHHADLVICFHYWRDCLFHALPMVPLNPLRGTQETLRVEDEGILAVKNGLEFARSFSSERSNP